MLYRDELLRSVKSLLMGPDPLPGYAQENGEEILYYDSPLKKYITGVLFPQMKVVSDEEEETEVLESDDGAETDPGPDGPVQESPSASRVIAEPTLDEETSKINCYQQSAMGITVCVPYEADGLSVNVSVGSYAELERRFPREKRNDEGKKTIIMSDRTRTCYYRKQHSPSVSISRGDLPTVDRRYINDYPLSENGEKPLEGLGLSVTFRLDDPAERYTIYTITLINTRTGRRAYPKVSECWFQASFDVKCGSAFRSLPDNFCSDITDSDYQLNALLYRNVKTYGIGHGCAATWDPDRVPDVVHASVMPEFEVKPIIPSTSRAELSMLTYATDFGKTVSDLTYLCNEYDGWIDEREKEIPNLDERFTDTATKQIEKARECLSRMRNGLALLQTDEKVKLAFQLANRAMLMQQLHYNMPLTYFDGYDTKELDFRLKNPIKLPDISDPSTWYNPGHIVYGRWRPFQIAFILLNLVSMNDGDSEERGIVDLIWFPTGGGKTEAYLGLTAFSILLRRLKNPKDSGTTVIMRYTLRLLTAQQYERASSLICSLEKIRSENSGLLGSDKITIGLWVGDSLTDNSTSSAKSRLRKIQRGEEPGNVSVVLKCPWCGASMETFKSGNSQLTPGYVLSDDKKHLLLCCGNPDCDYHDEWTPLPLRLFDDDIYENPPTLLFGTVDKFAMLPFKPQAKVLFGGDGEHTPPELIIQDELHLITGPLGSTVGLYETLIDRLCSPSGKKPKIIASTATISHAKQQCNALYDCGEENVFQFPVPGLNYNDCFFAKEATQSVGRKYVGLYGSSAASSATASIFTFAALLYADKALPAKDEALRDPYWTNLCYFGSMRELGQAATWYIADIKERLEVLYQNHLGVMDGPSIRRYLYDSDIAELTSRMSNNEIPQILKRLEVKYTDREKKALNMCLATNMVSVGVDVQRLGLMTVTGQPKSFSEYIQATSRVGRSSSAPGLVFVIYNTSKPRDKSYYERFQTQHAQLYKNVEPTSVTPFSRPLRERAMHAIFAALHRFNVDPDDRNNARRFPTEKEFDEIVGIISERAKHIDPDEYQDLIGQLKHYLKEWQAWTPSKYDSLSRYATDEEAPLLYGAGLIKPESWGERGWSTPMSMRNVDRECRLDCSRILTVEEEENDHA